MNKNYEEVEVNSERWFDLKPLLNEEFKDIVGYEGLYQVSNYGRIKSLEKEIIYIDNRIRHNKEKILSNKINRKGKQNVIYYTIKLFNNKESKNFEIHRIVAKTFIPNPENKPTVDHITPTSFYKCDNRACNLRWATFDEQQKHAFNNCGKISPMKGKINTYNCKKVEQYDNDMKLINTFLSLHDIERQLGYNFKCISNCCIANLKNKNTHKSYGYIWKFKEE